MTKLMTRVGDKVLGSLLRKDEAGACTECPGPCGYKYGTTCISHVKYNVRCNQVYTCDCGCQPTTCVTTSVIGSC
jgi:hypothetical protein